MTKKKKKLTREAARKKILQYCFPEQDAKLPPFRIASGKIQVDIVREILLEKQGGLCPICGIDMLKFIPAKDRCVDHSHKDGKIRAVLCRNCNGLLGKITRRVDRGRRKMSRQDYIARIWKFWEMSKDLPPLLHYSFLTATEKKDKANAKARRRYAAKKGW